MSQRLPAIPRLDYLKKQAKDVLRVFRRRNPRRRLADAQHAIARGYGFPNWPILKQHVESAMQPAKPVVRDALTAMKHASVGTTISRSQPAEFVARTDDQNHPIVGTWHARAPDSFENRQHPYQGALVDFDMATDVIMLTQVTLNTEGREVALKVAIRADGQEHPAQYGRGLVLQARWQSARVLEAVVKTSDRVLSRGTYEVSADGRSLTFSTADQLVTFERM